MGAERDRHVTLIGLEVTDAAGYAQYRNAMASILARHGGAFGCDFVGAQVLKGPDLRINRVFTLTFPSCAHRDRFFRGPGVSRGAGPLVRAVGRSGRGAGENEPRRRASGLGGVSSWPNARSRTLASPLPPACAEQRSE